MSTEKVIYLSELLPNIDLDSMEFLMSNFVKFTELEYEMDDTIDTQQVVLNADLESLNINLFFLMFAIVLVLPLAFFRIVMSVRSYEEKMLTTVSRVRQSECQ